MRNFLAGVIRTQNPEQTRPQPPVERGWADKADSRPVGWGTGARTLGSGGNSTHFKVGLSPAPMATFPAAPPLKFRTAGFPQYGFKFQAPLSSAESLPVSVDGLSGIPTYTSAHLRGVTS